MTHSALNEQVKYRYKNLDPGVSSIAGMSSNASSEERTRLRIYAARLENRIAELEKEVLTAQEIGEDIGRKGALDDVLALPVLIGNVIRISDIEALRGEDKNDD